MAQKRNLKLLIAGGGTGGHVLAGIAVADAWRAMWVNQAEIRNDVDFGIQFVGARGGLEEVLVPKAHYPLQLVSIGTLNRVSLAQKMRTGLQLPWAILRAVMILMRFRPSWVLGVGGYASGPVVMAAGILKFLRLLNVKVGVLEQNSILGMTNRILVRFADLVFVAFPGMESALAGKKVLVTGNPIRSDLRPLAAAPRNPFTVFIFGGSRGAVGINTLVLKALPYLEDLAGQLKIIHQTGELDYDRVRNAYLGTKIPVRVEKFIFDMLGAYQESSLLICRAGSSTLSEIAAVGRAAILIPLPTAADNHQEKNARVYSDADAAILLVQQASSGEELAKQIRQLMGDSGRVAQIEKNVTRFFKPDSAVTVARGLSEYV